jgi:beta-glucosidase
VCLLKKSQISCHNHHCAPIGELIVMKPASTLIIMNRHIACLFIATASLLGQQNRETLFRNPSATPEARAADLVSRMSLEEKVSQMQNSAPAIPRLGIPAYDWWNEGLHGVARAGLATVFPLAIGMAATWDTELMHRIATVISIEARGKYNDAIQNGNHNRYFGLTIWSPNINIFRDPRWGRGQETYGEDPFLTSRMGVAFVRGLQGDDPQYFRVIATAKHFAVHSGPEKIRHEFNVDVDPEDLKQTYLPAFEATVKEAKADSVMCAYNRVNGVPACASEMLLDDTLRKNWGFQGFVVSDCGAIGDVFQGHHYRPDMAQAAAVSVKAGTDLSCGKEYRAVTEAVHQGLISESAIDESLKRLFIARVRLGMFDPPERVPFSKISMKDVDTQEHRELALEAARESIVLLKNDKQLLPLKESFKNFAILGPAADDPDVLLGNYNGIPSRLVTPLEGIQRVFGAKVTSTFSLGSTYTPVSTALIAADVLSADGNAGLRAEYFANTDFTGNPAIKRIEPKGYFRWDMRDPQIKNRVPREKFSLRWSGSIRVDESGEYAVGVKRFECAECKGNDSARLYLDDRLIVEHAKHASYTPEAKIAKVHLEAGKSYAIRVDYSQDGGAGGLELVWLPPADLLLRQAKAAIDRSDLAILCVGLNSNLEGEESNVQITGFSGGDRTSIALPAPQEELLKTALASEKPVVVVLMNGSALGLSLAKDKAAAILEAWYPGQDGGLAIANTLSGESNPAGRLPITFYESVNQLPAFTDYSMKGRTYRYFAGKPLYPFGYGLSYSNFRYSGLSIQGNTARVTIKNDSSRDGDEVLQVYAAPANSPGGLQRQLVAFDRVHLKAGESRSVTLVIRGSLDGMTKLSVGGGQPLNEWTGGHFSEIELNR